MTARKTNIYRKRKRPLTAGRVMRRVRVAVSVLMLIVVTVLFTALSEKLLLALGWAAKIQIGPLAMGGAISGLAVWLLLTMIFGRIYCSSVCPLGVLQDIFAHLPRRSRSWRLHHPYHFREASNRLRYTWLVLILICLFIGVALITSLFDPYSAFGRIVGESLSPAVQWLGGEKVISASLLAAGVAWATLVAVGYVSWKHGRLVCNTFCPVGTALSVASRWSLFHFDIDTDVCINCRGCEHVCKGECISMNDHRVDSSRCVMCFNCVDTCSEGAIRYTTRHKKLAIPMLRRATPAFGPAASSSVKTETDNTPVRIDRRRFLATGLLVAAAPAMSVVTTAVEKSGRDGLSQPLHPTRPVAPPGRRTMASFLDVCTGCGLCITHCPGHALVHSTNEYGWLHVLHPVMDYNRGSCQFDCTLCTDLCPTKALNPLTIDDKHIFIIGHARVAPFNCVGCRLCSERCPKFAITMKARSRSQIKEAAARGVELSPLVAEVDTSKCIGCGVCQNVCPARPNKAIVVDGIV